MYGLNAKGQSLFDTDIACASISAFAVALRVFSKVWHKQGIRSDDYWSIVALVFYLTSVGCMQWGRVTGGGGMEMSEMLMLVSEHPEKIKLIEHFLEASFLGYTFVLVAQYGVKMSVLFFYRRIFFITKGYQRASLAVMAVATAWFIATQIVNLLTCQPIDSFWRRLKVGTCLNFNVMFLVTGIFDTVIDMVILLLPVRMALALQLPMRTRIAVAGIFALGGFVVITNIIRLRCIYNPNARYVRFSEAERWLNIHVVTAFVCASLPVCKPLWNTISRAAGNIISHYTSSIRSMLGASNNKSENTSYIRMNGLGGSLTSKERGIESVYPASSDKKLGQTITSVIGGHEEDCEPLHVPKGSIVYSRKVDVV
ncbi:hypothetical protein BU26DRAFT_551453 [Trematosphaeria pertusa]|uniref:Rhodopsin domain-containing protein n=1 Tax=Trematosphaeria pertusa TaxID=390896 RepID=A0A6A6IEW2_9PLEO|nr:uncharacterized protein BU26DRAFT_551453 [Trematosphaeria pertusa]KAF2248053.1 hypothetical protein BU26DRAFT_551453 [Trematosphaeria pertusa]